MINLANVSAGRAPRHNDVNVVAECDKLAILSDPFCDPNETGRGEIRPILEFKAMKNSYLASYMLWRMHFSGTAVALLLFVAVV